LRQAILSAAETAPKIAASRRVVLRRLGPGTRLGTVGYPSGYITRYDHADAQLIYRRPLKTTESAGKTTVRIPAARLPGDRTVRYYLLTGRDASPSGMLTAYRQYQARAH
jgi:hypothetical protein